MITNSNVNKYFDFIQELYCHASYIINTLNTGTKRNFNLQLELPNKFSWPPAKKWFSTIFPALAQKVVVKNTKNVPQIYNGVVMLKANTGNKTGLIAFDYSDYPEKINAEALSHSILYFKMQYLKTEYSDPKIIPGQFVPAGMELYWFLPSLSSLQKQQKYNYDVYGRFGSSFATEIRAKAVDLLKFQNKFEYAGDLRIIRYSRYLKEISQSKICIDLPGNGPFCFRLIEYLALGTCIIGPPHTTTFYPPLKDGIHIKYCKPDLSDLIELCEYYLNHEKERISLAHGAKNYFDSYLNKDKLADYYLTNIIKALQ